MLYMKAKKNFLGKKNDVVLIIYYLYISANIINDFNFQDFLKRK